VPAAALKKFATVADKPEWAVIYYAGHGISVRGNNDLVPVDAKLASDRDVTFEAITQGQVMQTVEGASKLPLVILDACRRSPAASCQARTSFLSRNRDKAPRPRLNLSRTRRDYARITQGESHAPDPVYAPDRAPRHDRRRRAGRFCAGAAGRGLPARSA
jgi:hypothetical protein